MIEKLKASKAFLFPMLAGVMAAGSPVVAFASETGGGGGGSLPSFAITEEMLAPLVEGVMANVQVILPIGLGLFTIFLGIRLIPNLISRFVRL